MDTDLLKERLAEAAYAAAYAAGYHAGMTDAMRLMNGERAALPVITNTSLLPVPTPAQEPSKPTNGQKGNHIKQFQAAANRRLKIAQFIHTDGPASMDEIIRELDLKYHAVYSAVNDHPWFEKDDHDRKIHLTTEGTNAAREANGQTEE